MRAVPADSLYMSGMPTPTSIRLDEAGERTVGGLAKRWGCSSGEVHRRLVRAMESAEALEVVERVTWPKQLDPAVKNFRVARNWKGFLPSMHGVGACEAAFVKGAVVSRTENPDVVEILVQRGALLEPAP
jgi:hypothetical protein